MQLTGHTMPIYSIAASANGRQAVSVGHDCQLVIWRLADARVLARYTADVPLTACAVAPNGTDILAADSLGQIHHLRLIHIRDDIADLLVELTSDSVYVRRAALRKIADSPPPALARAIRDLTTDHDPLVRRIVAQILGVMGDPSSLGALTRLLYDGDRRVHREAMYSLEHIGTPEALAPIRRWQHQRAGCIAIFIAALVIAATALILRSMGGR